MKKIVLLALFVMFGAIASCGGTDDITSLADVSLSTIPPVSATFPLIAGVGEVGPVPVDLTENDDFNRYKDNIKEVDIDYMKYAIDQNAGIEEGTVTFYANTLGGAFDDATAVATASIPASLELPEISLRGVEEEDLVEWFDVQWLDKAYFESLLITGQANIWAKGDNETIYVVIETEIKINIVANPL